MWRQPGDLLQRLYEIMRGGEKDELTVNLLWFRRFLLMHVLVRSVMAARNPVLDQPAWLTLLYCLLVGVCGAGLLPRLAWPATATAAGLVGLQIAGTMPITANHVFLEFLCLGLLALCRESRPQECELATVALRWLVAIALFYSGLQKVVYGHYFDGQFLAYATAVEDRFAGFFRHFMPDGEFLRLRSLGAAEPGMGPYRAQSVVFVAVSNAAYLVELVAPFLLGRRCCRAVAGWGVILFILMIEAGARELLFGGLMINLVLFFCPGGWVRRLFPWFALLYLYLLAAHFGLLPMFRYYH